MNERELLFIVRFKNEAQRQLGQLRRQLRNVGAAAADLAKRGFVAASVALRSLGATARQVGARLRTIGTGIRELGTNIAFGLGAPLAAAFGLAARESIRFEDTLIGIGKTVDGTTEQIAGLGEEITTLSNRLPVGANELGRIAAAAGQLGIQRGAIAEFTETVARLAVSSEDLGETEAAFALARIGTVLQLPQDAADNLGAAIVDLGNNFATTEGEIVDAAQRIAPIGATFDLTAGSVLGIATALRQAGQQSQAGGTAIQRTLIEIQKATSEGGRALQVFADTAGVSVDQFRTEFETNAAGALTQFIEGLARVKAEGGDTIKILDDLGLADARLTRVLLGLASAGDTLGDAIARGNTAFEENTALVEESDKFFSSFSKRLIVVRNQIQNAARALGDAFRPQLEQALGALSAFAGFIQRVAQFVANLDDRTRTLILTVAGIAVALGPVLIVFGTFLAILGSAVSGLGVLISAVGSLVGVFTALVPLLAPAGAIIGGLLLFTKIILEATSDTATFGEVTKEVINGVIRVFQTLGTVIGFVFSSSFTIISNFFENVTARAATFGKFLRGVLTGDFSAAFQALAEESSAPGIFDGVSDQAELLRTDLENIFAADSDPLGEGIAAIKARFDNLFNFELPEVARAGGEMVGEEFAEGVTKGVEEAAPALSFFERLTRSAQEFTDQLATGVSQGFEDFAETARDVTAGAKAAFTNFATEAENAILDFIETGKFNFADFATSVLREINRILVRLLLVQAFEGIAGAFGGGGGGGGIGGAVAGLFAKGGMSDSPSATAVVPARAFRNAPRFQAGGRVGVGRDTIPALLSPGERVLTPEQNAAFEAGGGGATEITVNINGVTDFNSFRQNRGAVEAAFSAMLDRANSREN